MSKNVLQTIRSRTDSFSRGQKRIADYILMNYDKAAFMTAGHLGRKAQVSESTVVRFASQLGYDGYPNMQRALQELVASGVLTVFDAGTEPVWRIAPEQHLVAAFYRNTVIHMLVERAIGEVSLLDAIAAPEGADVERAAWERAKALRDLLKFEFFFPGRDDFERELRAELALMSPISPAEPGVLTSAAARAILDATDLHVAHLVLRPFVDAYLVVADRLAAAGDSAVAEEDILDEALRVGQQWELERRIASAESVSLELYKTALRLARHRGLLGGEGGDTAYEGESLSARRAAFLVELQGVATQLDQIDRIEQARRSARGVR